MKNFLLGFMALKLALWSLYAVTEEPIPKYLVVTNWAAILALLAAWYGDTARKWD